MSAKQAAYDDGEIRCDDHALSIRRYYPWGSKQIPYTSIKSVDTLPLTGRNKVRKWRLWGSGDFITGGTWTRNAPTRTSRSCSTLDATYDPRSRRTTQAP